jgi:hypothetical protein
VDYLVIPGVTREDQIEGLGIVGAFSIIYNAAASAFLSGDKEAFGILVKAAAHLRARDIELGAKYSPRVLSGKAAEEE